MKSLDLNYKWKFFIVMEISCLFIMAFFSLWMIPFVFVDKSMPHTWFYGIVATIFFATTILSWLWSQWTYHFYKYEITSGHLKKESGVIWKRYTTIPYSRVQNIDIKRGVLDRIFGLSCLVVQTAGSSTPHFREGEIPGLSAQTAEKLREELTQRIEKLKDRHGGL